MTNVTNDKTTGQGVIGHTHGSHPTPLVLVQFPPIWGVNFTPATAKLDAWLRFAGIPFTIRHRSNLRRSDAQGMPYVIDGGTRIADAGLIIEHLKRTRLIDPDGWLDGRQLAESVAMQRLFEHHLDDVLTYARWLDPEGWKTMRGLIAEAYPAPLAAMIGWNMRRKVGRKLQGSAIAKHSRTEIYRAARDDLAAISIMLGRKPYVMGEHVSSIDAVAYGYLSNILIMPFETELRRIADEFCNLRRWCRRVEAELKQVSAPVQADEPAIVPQPAPVRVREPAIALETAAASDYDAASPWPSRHSEGVRSAGILAEGSLVPAHA